MARRDPQILPEVVHPAQRLHDGPGRRDLHRPDPISESTLTRMICGMTSSNAVKSRLAAIQAIKYRQLPCSSCPSTRLFALFFVFFKGFRLAF